MMAYTAAGYGVSDLHVLLATKLFGGAADADEKTKLNQAITDAGQAAATWKGTDWWWLHSRGEFDTVADTSHYALRTVNGNDMADLWAVERAYYDDDWPLEKLSWRQYQKWLRIEQPTASTSKPLSYMVTGEPPRLYVRPTPDDAYTVYIDYVRRHGAITTDSAATDLIVPAEFQRGVYVEGAAWLIAHEKKDIRSLEDCPGFRQAMERMVQADPKRYDVNPEDYFPDAQGPLPHNRRVIQTGDGYLVQNTVSI
jgi:hypothetical protein